MARIAGVDLPRRKRLDVALTYIYGVGDTLAKEIVAKTGIEDSTKVQDLTEEEVRLIRNLLEAEYTVEGDLRREIQGNIKRLKDLNCYRGIRHRKGLPVRGQRTRTNARSRRGPRRAMVRKRK
ncbi:30S ribosomal protein S13 [Bradymonas sediminis]|uniref:Small ribosomal subunit protein uS13 n=1 Tax=Bradymonas sediminis TaxID=1548548 RepID=A0A2Z4FH03_9DELT|nr:30S ribosomal protein S13 [Bradymonas sediminis]AWV88005.1 30S ribosomal protein S13 [Bradymonas sediminis]TDP77128.1 SSU ribosomal protein S13P [Bradymonas sediminis]